VLRWEHCILVVSQFAGKVQVPTPPPPQVFWQTYSQVMLSLQVHSPVEHESGLLVLPQSQAVVQGPPSVDEPPPQPKSKTIENKKKRRTEGFLAKARCRVAG
jgi:hypothetical protein